jgi:hypothetical protein
MALSQPRTSTSGWIDKGTEVTTAFEDRQGTEIVLDEIHRSWTLRVVSKSGERSTLGIWGIDSSGRDAVIYNGAFKEGQEIPVGMEYRDVHIAVNIVRDDPPIAQRWLVLGKWHRQSLRPAHVELRKWVFK